MQPLVDQWRSSTSPPSDLEVAKRLIDLFLVSVLLDAGAGNEWKYAEKGGETYTRSEGLAVASYDMFTDGFFSGDKSNPCQVDGEFHLKRGLCATSSILLSGWPSTCHLFSCIECHASGE